MDIAHASAVAAQLALNSNVSEIPIAHLEVILATSDLLRQDPMRRLADATALQESAEGALRTAQRNVDTLQVELASIKSKIVPLQEINAATEQARQQLAAELAALKGA